MNQKTMKTFNIIVIVVALVLVSLAGLAYYKRDVLIYLYTEAIEKGKAVAYIRPNLEAHFASAGVMLRGALYVPDGDGPFPGIVLAHGGTPLGRKLTLYRLLSHLLAKRGYVVLSFDFRGYGESDDPVVTDIGRDLNFVEDLRQAVTELRLLPQVDANRIFLLGHSFGAGVIIPAGVQDKRVHKIVAIAPGRRGNELFWDDEAPAKHYPRERLAQDMEIPAIHDLPVDAINPLLQYLSIETILDFPEHPPILLIDGENEHPKDQEFLQHLYAAMTEPKAYYTIPEADHYFGARRDDLGVDRVVSYWANITDHLVAVIDEWLRTGTLPAQGK